MRKLLSLVAMLAVAAMSMMSCAGDTSKVAADSKTEKEGKMETDFKGKKILVAFFSHTGENYGVGNIKEGNTHVVAKMIAEATGGTLFEIVPERDYPHDSYDEVVEIARDEKARKARPAIKGDVDVENYDVVFLGYPNWWGDMPMAVYTFLEKHDWKGKRVLPFCTHEGSGLSATERYVEEVCVGADVAQGLAVRGATTQHNREEARKAVESWLEKN